MGDLVFTGDVVIYLLGLAVMWGSFMVRIKALEKKMDKHNCLIERMAIAETKISDLEKKGVTK